MLLTSAQSRAARGLLDWTQRDLATAARVSLSTVRGFEAGSSVPVTHNLEAIHRAFEAGGITFPDAETVRRAGATKVRGEA